MVLVSDVLDHIGWIYSPLNLANVNIKKIKIAKGVFNNQHFHAVYIMCMQPLPDSSQTFTGL